MKLFQNRFNIKLLLLFNQYKIASNARSMGIDVYKLSMSDELRLLHSLSLSGAVL